jgi:hypothetical protein
MCVLQRPWRLPFYDRMSVERLCFSYAALFDKTVPFSNRKEAERSYIRLELLLFIYPGFLMLNNNLRTALDTLFAEPQSHVVLKMQGNIDPHQLGQLSSKWWEPLVKGYYFDCFVDESGTGFVHFRDHSFGTKFLPTGTTQAVKQVFSTALSSDETSTWELQAFDSLRAAHIYMGTARR